MSFSFTVKGDTHALVKEAAKAAMDKIVEQQPIHECDRANVLAVVDVYVGLLSEPEAGDEVVANINGYLTWHGDQSNREFIGASVSASVSLRKKEI